MNKFFGLIAFFAIIACAMATFTPGGKIIKVGASALECEACHVIVDGIDKWLADNKTTVEIEKNIEVVCTLLRSAEAACDAIVEAGVPTVINWIETNETPEIACGPTQLKVCTSK